MWVPKTCCVLEFNQDRDVRHVDPDDAVPRDEKKCQEQGQGNIDTGEYLHGRVSTFTVASEPGTKHSCTIVEICVFCDTSNGTTCFEGTDLALQIFFLTTMVPRPGQILHIVKPIQVRARGNSA